MFGFLFRATGLILLVASFVALIADGVRSVAAERLVVTPLGATWYALDPSSLGLAQAVVQRYVAAFVWDPVIQTVLLWPTFAVGGVFALILMALGRRRPRRAAA